MYSLRRFGIKLEMDTIRHMLETLGNPHNGYNCIHIAGTNGKGSIAATLATILLECGYRVGRYTSPHLQRFNERITIDNKPVEDQDVVDAYNVITTIPSSQRQPTFFEFTTAMALYLFKQKKVEWAVVETGMGGRMDATNIIAPRATVITNISLEHKAYLGDSLAAIAGEKAGIIKKGVPLVTGVHQKTAFKVIEKKAAEMKIPVFRKGRDFKTRRQADKTMSYYGISHNWKNLSLSLEGDHQIDNTALALATLEVLSGSGQISLDHERLAAGLVNTKWPGRLEIVCQAPLVILDGAHNLMAARVLAAHLAKTYKQRPLTLVVGILNDKPYRIILKDLASLCTRVIVTQPTIDRALPASTLKMEAVKYCSHVEIVDNVGDAVAHALKTSGKDDVICVAGSLYVVGEAKTEFEKPRTIESCNKAEILDFEAKIH